MKLPIKKFLESRVTGDAKWCFTSPRLPELRLVRHGRLAKQCLVSLGKRAKRALGQAENWQYANGGALQCVPCRFQCSAESNFSVCFRFIREVTGLCAPLKFRRVQHIKAMQASLFCLRL